MKPWLLLPPKLAHDLSPLALELLSTFRERRSYEWRPFTWRGLHFDNPLGIAGGVDKDGGLVEAWWTLGPGFIEIGTVTPKPQEPNEGKIIDRDPESLSLWNRMGFPGGGVDHVRQNLSDLPVDRTTPIFVNIGKNRATPNELAANDYVTCINEIDDLADAFVVNISSPNTKGLRDLFLPSVFGPFLQQLLDARERTRNPNVPLLLKLSPDLEDEDLVNVVRTAVDLGIDGFIATNTTLARSPGLPYPKEGGVSGRPLSQRSKEVLTRLIQILGPSREGKLIVSVGGVLTPEDVFERLSLGADLVQVYTALIYEGPFFFSRVARVARF